MPEVTIRRATPADVPAAGQICFEAFHQINTAHNFAPDIPAPEIAVGFLSMLFSHPGFYCVVAEQDGRIIGSNCLDERNPVAGIGPITIDPKSQNHGVGRLLMKAVMDRASEGKFPSVRLVQAAFHNRSLSLYTKLGFDTREPLSCMQGPKIGISIDGCTVRPAGTADLEACGAVCRSVHGHDRSGELADAVQMKTATVVERHGRITGYATAVAFFAHAVAESDADLQALIAAAPTFAGPGFLVPTRNADLLRWCFERGLRIVQPLTLMTLGLYNEPRGAYLPSIIY
jgi:GNAT superfamily N-acetyltransferase